MSLSAYDQSKLQARTQAAQAARRQRTLDTHRRDVESVQECADDREMNHVQVRRYDSPDGQFRGIVEEQHDAMVRRRVFWLAVLAYVISEYFVAGNVAEWLATEVMPMVKDLKWVPDEALNDIDMDASGVPLWLRRSVGVGFVGIMLAGTLVLKFLTHWLLSRAKAARQTLVPGQHVRAALLAAQITALISVKIVFLVMVAGLYLWLFGFSQERAEFVDLMKQEQTEIVDPLLGFKIDESGNLATQDKLPSLSETDEGTASGGSMAYATAVCYVMCWCIHGLLLAFPVSGFSHKLRHANFDRDDALEEAEQARRERVRLNRQILERIDEETDPEIKEALVRAVQPIRHLIMEDAGQDDPGTDLPGAGAPVTRPPTPPSAGSAAAAQNLDPASETVPVRAADTQPNANVFDLLFGGEDEGQTA